jgi:hypothetical protein
MVLVNVRVFVKVGVIVGVLVKVGVGVSIVSESRDIVEALTLAYSSFVGELSVELSPVMEKGLFRKAFTR